jgi:hypothetical protein
MLAMNISLVGSETPQILHFLFFPATIPSHIRQQRLGTSDGRRDVEIVVDAIGSTAKLLVPSSGDDSRQTDTIGFGLESSRKRSGFRTEDHSPTP